MAISLKDFKNKHLGKVGTINRDRYERELNQEMKKETGKILFKEKDGEMVVKYTDVREKEVRKENKC
ncbi:hypothetical protein V6R21_04850 [Limibacter armeniacum]|uniref:hypothetical protein n=1 Tax=Limibacter armeniacum TaxID=466084 RepID=UPI002FE68D03